MIGMTSGRRLRSALAGLSLLAVLGGCAHDASPQLAIPQATGDTLGDTAALLATAELARDASERAPLIDRLNAMNVKLAEGGEDDPLSVWRSEHQAEGGTPYRGRTLGPAYRRARVAPGASLTIDQIFYAGERAQIAAQASSGGNVALAIHNPRNEAVCAKSLAPSANCNWLPIFTERFSIELENRGSQPASVYIVFR